LNQSQFQSRKHTIEIDTLPRITIVTPSFNQGRFLEETMRSVLSQGYPNLEYIVIDGGSTDNSVDIIRQYASQLAYWVSEKDNGQASAINKGFRKSTGQIMAWLNSDDCLKPGALWNIVSAFQKHPSWQIVCGFRDVIDTNSKHLDYTTYIQPDRFSFSRICYVPQETVFWRRAVWETAGGLDESFQFALDFDLWQRYLAAGFTFHLIPRYLGLFRTHSNSKNTRWVDVRASEIARIYKKYLNTEKHEIELRREISSGWWYRMRIMKGLAWLRLLHISVLAEFIVNALSLDEMAVANSTFATRR
jgi:glycosyltransferase involved in cell wall biosynthesis